MRLLDRCPLASGIKLAVAFWVPDQHDSAGRVLSMHVYESSPQREEDYGHIGFKGRGPIQVLSVALKTERLETK